MSTPNRHSQVLQSPHPTHMKLDDKGQITMSRDLYTFLDTLRTRTGGATANTVNLKGLEASVGELNTLVGIDTASGQTVQKQLDIKANSSSLGTIASQNANNVTLTGGTITGLTIDDSEINLRVGTTAESVKPGGTLDVNVTDVGNGAGAETDLMTYEVLAETLSADKMYLEIEAFGITAANANNKEIKVIFGTTTLYASGSVAANGSTWNIKATIIRTGASAQKCITSTLSDGALIVDSSIYVSATENLATDLTFKVTGNGVAANDVVQKGLVIKWYKV